MLVKLVATINQYIKLEALAIALIVRNFIGNGMLSKPKILNYPKTPNNFRGQGFAHAA